MNNLPSTEMRNSEEFLGVGSLEKLRADVQHKIFSDISLTYKQRKNIVAELDYYIECEKHRRAQESAKKRQEFEEFRFEHLNRNLLRKRQFINQAALDRKKLILHLTKLNREVLEHKVAMIERVKRLKPSDESLNFLKKAKSDLLRLRLQRKISCEKERLLHSNLTERALNRAKFIKRVQDQYPELAEELIDYYDRQIFRMESKP